MALVVCAPETLLTAILATKLDVAIIRRSRVQTVRRASALDVLDACRNRVSGNLVCALDDASLHETLNASVPLERPNVRLLFLFGAHGM
jgi:hypothetical protein